MLTKPGCDREIGVTKSYVSAKLFLKLRSQVKDSRARSKVIHMVVVRRPDDERVA